MPTKSRGALPSILLLLVVLLASVGIQADEGIASSVDSREDRQLQLKDDPTRFNIDLVYDTTITEAQRAGFEFAKNKWMSIITKDSAVATCFPKYYKTCGHQFTVRTCVDDLLIIVRVKPIDGVGEV